MRKKFKIIADPRVEDDLKDARDFLESQRKGLAKKFFRDYRKSLNSLEINPFFQKRYKEIFCLPLGKFKYMIHFQINE